MFADYRFAEEGVVTGNFTDERFGKWFDETGPNPLALLYTVLGVTP